MRRAACTKSAGFAWCKRMNRYDVIIGLGCALAALGLGLMSVPLGILAAGVELIAWGGIGAFVLSRQGNR